MSDESGFVGPGHADPSAAGPERSTFESGFGSEPADSDTEWCFFSGSAFNLVDSGVGYRQVDLSSLNAGEFRHNGEFSINENGSIVVPTPGLYLVVGGASGLAADVGDGSILVWALKPEVEGTLKPDMPHWPISTVHATLEVEATIYGLDMSFSGMVTMPSAQDIGPLKLMVDKTGGWSTAEIGINVQLGLIRLAGTGAYTAT